MRSAKCGRDQRGKTNRIFGHAIICRSNKKNATFGQKSINVHILYVSSKKTISDRASDTTVFLQLAEKSYQPLFIRIFVNPQREYELKKCIREHSTN